MKFLKFLGLLTKISDSISSVSPDAGKKLYKRVNQLLHTFLAQDATVVNAVTRFKGLTVSTTVYARLRIRFAANQETCNLLNFLFSEMGELLLEHYAEISPDNDAVSTFVKGMDSTVRLLKNKDPDCYLFKALADLRISEWSNPTLNKMMNGDEVDRDEAVGFFDNIECEEVVRLRIQILKKKQEHLKLCNLYGWCLHGKVYNNDEEMMVEHFALLHRFNRMDEFCLRAKELRCCYALRCIQHMNELPHRVPEETFQFMCQAFAISEFTKFTGIVCAKEILENYLRAEYNCFCPENRAQFLESCHEVLVCCRDGRQHMIFVENLQSMFGEEFIALGTEVGLKAIEKERIRLHCAEHYYRNNAEVKDTTANIVRTLLCLIKLYDRHLQMKLTCLLSAFALIPSVELFRSLESCCKDVTEWPSLRPEPIVAVDSAKYAQLLDAVNCLRDVRQYRPTPATWQSLRPILVKRFEEDGGRFKTAEKKYLHAMARSSVEGKGKSSAAQSGVSAAKARKSAVTSKNRKSSDTVLDLHMFVSEGENGGREEVEHTQTHPESTVTADTGCSADADGAGGGVINDASEVVEEDAASDVTIVTSDVDKTEFHLDNTEDMPTVSAELPLTDESLTNITISRNDATAEVKIDDLETKNITHGASRLAVSNNLPEDDTTQSPHVRSEFIDSDTLKCEEKDIILEEKSEMSYVTGSQLDVGKLSNDVAETTKAIGECNIASDTQPDDAFHIESEMAVSKHETDLSVLSSTHTADISKTDETQYVRDVAVDVEYETVASLVDAADYRPESSLSMTSESGSIVLLSDGQELSDVSCLHNSADEADDTKNLVKPQPSLPQTAVDPASESAQVSIETQPESEACEGNEIKSVVDDVGSKRDDTCEMDDKTLVDSTGSVPDGAVGIQPEVTASIPLPDMEMDTVKSFLSKLPVADSIHGAESSKIQKETQEHGVMEQLELPGVSSAQPAVCQGNFSEVNPDVPACSDLNTCSEVSMHSENVSVINVEEGHGIVPETELNEKAELVADEHTPLKESDEITPDILTASHMIEEGTNLALDTSVSLTGSITDVALLRCSVALRRISVLDPSLTWPSTSAGNETLQEVKRRHCSVVLQRLSPSLEQSLTKANNDDDDDNDSVITISSSDDDLPPEPSTDVSRGAAKETTAGSRAVSLIYVDEDISVINIEQDDGTVADTEIGERSEIGTEAATDSLIPDSATTSESLVAPNDNEIAGDEGVMDRDVAEFKGHHPGDETSQNDLTRCVTGRRPKNSEDNETEIPVGDSFLTPNSVVELPMAVDDNSERTEISFETADLVNWHPKHPLLSFYSDIVVDDILDKNAALDLAEELEKDVHLTSVLDSGDKVDLSPSIGQPTDIVVERVSSRDVVETLAAEAVDDISTPPTFANTKLSGSIRDEEDGKVKVTAGKDVQAVFRSVTEAVMVEANGSSLTALESAEVISSADAGLKLHDENIEVSGMDVEDDGMQSCEITGADGDMVTSGSLSASTDLVPSAVFGSKNDSAVVFDDSLVCSNAPELPAVGISDHQLWDKGYEDDSSITATASEGETMLSEVIVADTVEKQARALSKDQRSLSSNDITKVAMVEVHDNKLPILAAESIHMADDTSMVTEGLIEPTGLIVTTAAECAYVSNLQTFQTEDLEITLDSDKPVLCDDGDIVVCDPFPIFTEQKAHSICMDDLTQYKKLQDKIKEGTYSVVLQPDVPEPADEVYLSTSVVSAQSSSEEQSEVEDVFDTHNQVFDQSTDIASSLDVSITNEEVIASVLEPSYSEFLAPADSSISVTLQRVVGIQHDAMQYMKLPDEIKENAGCSLIQQPDVPEPADEVYFSTILALGQSSSEEKLEVEDVFDTRNQVGGQSSTDTSCYFDIGVRDEEDITNVNEPLYLEFIVAADDSINMNLEEAVDVQHDTENLHTASMANAEIGTDKSNLKLSNLPVLDSLRDAESSEVQKVIEEREVTEAHELPGDTTAQPAVFQGNFATVNADASTCSELDTQIELSSHHEDISMINVEEGRGFVAETKLAERSEIILVEEYMPLKESAVSTQETNHVVAAADGKMSSMSAMFSKLGAVCKTVQSKNSEVTPRKDLHLTTDEPEHDSCSEPLKSTAPTSPNTSHCYLCPYCSLQFTRYTDCIFHLRAENHRHRRKATSADSGSGKPAQEPTAESASAVGKKLKSLASIGKSKKQTASTGRSRKHTLPGTDSPTSMIVKPGTSVVQVLPAKVRRRSMLYANNGSGNLVQRSTAVFASTGEKARSRASSAVGKSRKQTAPRGKSSGGTASVEAPADTVHVSQLLYANNGSGNLVQRSTAISASTGEKARSRVSSAVGKSRKQTAPRGKSSCGTASVEAPADTVHVSQPEKYRRRSSVKLRASTGQSLKRPSSASRSSNSTAASLVESDTSVPPPAKTRRRSMPEPRHKDTASTSTGKRVVQKSRGSGGGSAKKNKV